MNIPHAHLESLPRQRFEQLPVDLEFAKLIGQSALVIDDKFALIETALHITSSEAPLNHHIAHTFTSILAKHHINQLSQWNQ